MHALLLALTLASSPEAVGAPAALPAPALTTPDPVDTSSRPGPGAHAARPLGLSEALSLALGHEPRVDEALLAAEQARLTRLRAQLERVSLRVDAQADELWVRQGGASDTVGLSQAVARLELPLFTGFRIQAGVARAGEQLKAATARLEEERLATALSVARAYFAVLRLESAGKVQRAALERFALAQQVAEVRARLGLVPPVDVNRVASQRAREQAEQARLEGLLTAANAELGVLLGIHEPIRLLEPPRVDVAGPARSGSPSVAPEVADERELARSAPGPVERWTQAAAAQRPLLGALRHETDAQAQAVRVARSAYYPQLSAFGQYGVGNPQAFLAGAPVGTAPRSENPFDGLEPQAQAGVRLSWNLFDTFRTTTSVKDAEYTRARTQALLRDAEQEVERQVRVAHARLAELSAQQEALQRAKALAEDSVSILRKRYERGDALILELLDAEVELLGSARRLAETQTDVQLAWLELRAASGESLGEQ